MLPAEAVDPRPDLLETRDGGRIGEQLVGIGQVVQVEADEAAAGDAWAAGLQRMVVADPDGGEHTRPTLIT